ncbi:unnamed protein product, partial [Choristocarpus tenellus]
MDLVFCFLEQESVTPHGASGRQSGPSPWSPSPKLSTPPNLLQLGQLSRGVSSTSSTLPDIKAVHALDEYDSTSPMYPRAPDGGGSSGIGPGSSGVGPGGSSGIFGGRPPAHSRRRRQELLESHALFLVGALRGGTGVTKAAAARALALLAARSGDARDIVLGAGGLPSLLNVL